MIVLCSKSEPCCWAALLKHHIKTTFANTSDCDAFSNLNYPYAIPQSSPSTCRPYGKLCSSTDISVRHNWNWRKHIALILGAIPVPELKGQHSSSSTRWINNAVYLYNELCLFWTSNMNSGCTVLPKNSLHNITIKLLPYMNIVYDLYPLGEGVRSLPSHSGYIAYVSWKMTSSVNWKTACTLHKILNASSKRSSPQVHGKSTHM